MGVNGKQKGADFERKICARLSLWASNLTRDDVFWRSSMSGGRATIRGRSGNDTRSQAGDITAIHQFGHPFLHLFFIECKFYRDLLLIDVVYGLDSNIPIIWTKPRVDAERLGLIPLVICKQNRREELVLTTLQGSDKLQSAVRPDHKLSLLAWFPTVGMYVYALRDILTSVDYDVLVKKPERKKLVVAPEFVERKRLIG